MQKARPSRSVRSASTQAHTQAHARTYARTHAPQHTRTHADTHTHTRLPAWIEGKHKKRSQIQSGYYRHTILNVMIFRFSTKDFNLCNFRSNFVFYPKFCIKPIYPPSPLNYDFGKTMHYIISLVNVKVRKVYEHLGGGGLDFFKIYILWTVRKGAENIQGFWESPLEFF